MKEEWKDIKGYEGLYQISNLGRVKSLARTYSHHNRYTHVIKHIQEKILKPQLRGQYLKVTLLKHNHRKQVSVHKLVAETFIPNPDKLPMVNHKDEDKLNNNINNLEWCNSTYNSNYGTRNTKISKLLTNNKKRSKQVLCVETDTIYPSTREAERQTGIRNDHIVQVCNHTKHYKTAGGFHWKYVERSDEQ